MHMVAYHGQAIALRGAESAMHVHMLGLYPEGGGESQSHTHAHGRSSPWGGERQSHKRTWRAMVRACERRWVKLCSMGNSGHPRLDKAATSS